MKIILGSGSKFRKAIMERAGYSFSTMSADVDERAIRTNNPYELPIRLSEAKAAALLPNISEPSLLVTSDTIVICEGKVYEKPIDADEIRAFMREYESAEEADIVTAVVVTNTQTGKQVSGVDTCVVSFKPVPDDVLEEFIRVGDPFSRAGGFSIEEGLLAPYVRTVKGTRDSIMGMPLALLKELLAKAGEDK